MAVPYVKSDKLKALAIASAQPSPLHPGLLIVAATLPGYEAASMFALFAPAKTPAAIINRLNLEVVRALNKADVKERFLSAGLEVVGSTPEELAIAMKSDMARLGKVIKDAGIRAE
jgi:tripartite-type tricarboxylate transporter receptor subunit TctC